MQLQTYLKDRDETSVAFGEAIVAESSVFSYLTTISQVSRSEWLRDGQGRS